MLGGIVVGSLGVHTGNLVTKVECGSYFSPDLSAAQARDESLVKRDWTDILKGEFPEPGTETRDACTAALDRKQVPVWSFVVVGGIVVLVGVVLAVRPPGSGRAA